MRTILAVVVVWAGVGTRVCAGPFEPGQISADATWLVHVDVDAIRAGTVPRVVAQLWLTLPGAAEDLKRLVAVLGMDPTKDLHGVTIYGRSLAPPDAVVILQAKYDRERLTALLRPRPSYRTEPYAGHELVTWIENQDGGTAPTIEQTFTGCFHQPTRIVLGQDGGAVRKALDVLDGKSPGMAKGDRLMAAELPAGAMVEVRAMDMADDGGPFVSPVVRQARSLCLALGERDGQVFAVARMAAESAKVAQQVQTVVAGFLAMAQLQSGDDQETADLLDAVKISRDDRTVAVEARGSTEKVGDIVRRAWAKQVEANQAP